MIRYKIILHTVYIYEAKLDNVFVSFILCLSHAIIYNYPYCTSPTIVYAA